MLSVILKILSILGIILLVLLGIILIVLLLVLFFPICYRIRADRQPVEKETAKTQDEPLAPEWIMHINAKVWWLFGLIHAGYKYPEPGILKIKLLFFTLYESGQDKSTRMKKSDISGKAVSEQSQEPYKEADAPTEHTSSNPRDSMEPFTDSSENSDTKEEHDTEENSLSPDIFEKIQYTIQKFYDKIKDIFRKIKEILENAAYYKEVLTSEETKALLKHLSLRLVKILKALRPSRLYADIHFGAASPDITGYVCAVYGMVCCHLGKHVVFTPDFEQEILEGKAYAAGHFTVFEILWNVLLLVRDKRLWELKEKLDQNTD